MMKVALLRYVERAAKQDGGGAAEVAGDVGGRTEDGGIVFGATLRRRLEASCKRCHGEDEHGFLSGEPVRRAVVEKMLVEVAWRGMPRAPAAMDAAERRAVVRGLVRALWSDAPTREEALRYFETGLATLPVHRGSALARMVERRAGARDEEAAAWTFSDEARHGETTYSPGFAVTFAYVALRMCKAAGHEGAELEECMQRAAGGDVAVKGR
jgi:hypothetical protein